MSPSPPVPRFVAACLFAALAAALPPAAAAPRSGGVVPVALVNPDFEEAAHAASGCPVGWGCTMHADPTAFRFATDPVRPYRGQGSLLIERVKNEPWALVRQRLDARELAGRTVRLKARVRLEAPVAAAAAAETAAAGLTLTTDCASGYSPHAQQMGTPGLGWRQVTVTLAIPADCLSVGVGALLEGPGRAWFDEVRLDVVPHAKPPR